MSVSTSVLVDPSIAQISDKFEQVILSGPAEINYTQAQPNQFNVSGLQFNVQLQSQNTVVDRAVKVRTPLAFTINVGTGLVATDSPVLQWGFDTSLSAWPLNNLFTTIQTTVNSAQTSINLQYHLPTILRTNNLTDLLAFNGGSPTYPDVGYFSYGDSLGASNSPMSGFSSMGLDSRIEPRGAFPCCVSVTRYVAGVATDRSLISTDIATNSWRIVVQTYLTESLMSSFLLWDNEKLAHQAMGFLGLNTMSINAQLDATFSRVLSTGAPSLTSATWQAGGGLAAGHWSITPGSKSDPNPFAFGTDYNDANPTPAYFQNVNAQPQLLLTQKSLQPSQVVPTRNIIPYYFFQESVTTSAAGAPIAAGGTGQSISNTISLSQIPDMFVISAGVTQALKNPARANAWMVIKGITITFNNKTVLSSATPHDLWRMSVANGSNQSWEEFNGQAFSFDPAQLLVPPAGVYGKKVATTGSILMLNTSEFSLSDELAPNSGGQFQFVITLQLQNQASFAYTPTITVGYLNTMLLETQMGVSQTSFASVTRETVLHAKTQKSLPRSAYNMMVGGRFFGKMSAHMHEGMMSGLAPHESVPAKMSKLKGMLR